LSSVIKLMRFDAGFKTDIRDVGRDDTRFNESDSDSDEIATGGRRCRRDMRRDARCWAGVSSDCSPSSDDIDTRGGSDASSVGIGGSGGDILDENEMREMTESLGEPPPRPEPCVLTLNRDWLSVDGFQEMVLSRLFDARHVLCLLVRSRTFFSVNGKYSARWFVMSSLGGR
jgi:hypothetical protein